MAIKSYLDYTGLKRVLKHLLPGARKIWHGTAEEWHALSDEERNKYDQAEVIDGSGHYSDYARNPHPDWANAVTITTAELAAGYKAPGDGMIVGYALGTAGGHRFFSVNNVNVSKTSYFEDAYAAYANTQVPVNKGDIFKSNGALSYAEFYFVPWKA